MTLREIADIVGGWISPEHEAIRVEGVASLADAGAGDISFFGNPRYLKNLRQCQGTAVLVPHGFGEDVPPVRLWVDNPAAAFAKVLEKFAPPPVVHPPGIHPTAIVSPEATIGADVHIGPGVVVETGAVVGNRSVVAAGAYIGHGVVIGEDCVIHPRVVVVERSRLGNRVILHPGVVIGSDGFGYEFRDGAQKKIPQTGIVQIDDDVEIGALTAVDRARFGRTWIKKGTKIDNLCQIGHNVTIGEHSILCGQVGISGSTRVGNYVTLAGKVGISGHIEIHDRAVVAAMAGIAKSVPPGEVMFGIPGRPIREFKENLVLLRNIHKLYERVQVLESQRKSDA